VAATLSVSVVLLKQFLPAGDGGQQAAAQAPGQNRAAVSAMAGTGDDSKSEQVWRQSVSDLNSRIDRIESELHSSAPFPEPIRGEIAALRERLDSLSAPLPDDFHNDTDSH
jgi:hypothetical protein